MAPARRFVVDKFSMIVLWWNERKEKKHGEGWWGTGSTHCYKECGYPGLWELAAWALSQLWLQAEWPGHGSQVPKGLESLWVEESDVTYLDTWGY